MSKKSFIGLVVIGALAFVSNSASALVQKRLPTGGTVKIGQISGDAWAAVSEGGVCSFVRLGLGGLNDQTDLHAQSNRAEYVSLVQSATTFCGHTITPLITNGWRLTVALWEGADSFYNTITQNVRVLGGAGDDILANYTSANADTGTFGENGIDNLLGDVGDFIDGGNDNDYICVTGSGSANVVRGGGGTNRLCGRAFFTNAVVQVCPCNQLF